MAVDKELIAKAKLLLVRRDASGGGLGYYVKRNWRRQLFLAAACTGVAVAAWRSDLQAFAIAVASFFVGAKLRDLRWWLALAREWPTTAELLDWEKIESLAAEQRDVIDPAIDHNQA